VSNQYLPVLGKIALFAKDSEVPERLLDLDRADQFLELLDRKAP
jgi:mannitol/fructose-specific phosphotransferase system IIA component (Ntr-type)